MGGSLEVESSPGRTVFTLALLAAEVKEAQLAHRPARRTDPSARLFVSCGRVLQPVAVGHKSLADYTHICGRALIDEIRELAEPLKGSRVVQISATAFGGGVSEILYTLVPLMRDVGLECEWQVIYGREEFFNATKLMHNALQGAPEDLDAEQWETWQSYNEMNARELSEDWDICLVHDPQPAALHRARAREGQGLGVALPHRPLDPESRHDRPPAALHPGLSATSCSICRSTCRPD